MTDHPNSALAQTVAVLAKDLGCELIGFSRAEPPRRTDEFRRWLDAGYAGTMSYLPRSSERRADPQRVLPEARTIISVGESYFTERLPDSIRNDPSRGLIAAYAWGDDYHDVLLQKLVRIERLLKDAVPGSRNRCYVDTGHILERDFGEQGGLGFTGKNTMLIHPRMGSQLFLGEVLTTVDLPPTVKPEMPDCGSCTRCLAVCPTHAFPAPFILNSNQCISYLTIEFRGVIPRDLRSKMGNHVFGCDDCQDCCPWNEKFSTPTREPRYAGTPDRQTPKLVDLACLTKDEFEEKFRGAAVLRSRYEGFLRSVAVALGNWGSPEVLPSLRLLLKNDHPLVRLHAAWAVGRIGGAEGMGILKRVAESDRDEGVRREATDALADK